MDRFQFEGQRHLPERNRKEREAAEKAREFRLGFLRNLKPNHPLFNSPEAQQARGEKVE